MRRPINLAQLSPLRRGLILGFMRAKRQARKQMHAMASDYDAELLALRDQFDQLVRTRRGFERLPFPRRPDWRFKTVVNIVFFTTVFFALDGSSQRDPSPARPTRAVRYSNGARGQGG